MTNEIRPDHRSVLPLDPNLPPRAHAARPGTCSHGKPAEQDDLIFLTGAEIVVDDERRTVDVSGAEWHPVEHCWPFEEVSL